MRGFIVTGAITGVVVTAVLLVPLTILTLLVRFLLLERRKALRDPPPKSLLSPPPKHSSPTPPFTPSEKQLQDMELTYNEAYATKREALTESLDGLVAEYDHLNETSEEQNAGVPLPLIEYDQYDYVDT